jgi:hypothetical protein
MFSFAYNIKSSYVFQILRCIWYYERKCISIIRARLTRCVLGTLPVKASCFPLHQLSLVRKSADNEAELYIELTKWCTVGAIVLQDHNNLQWCTMET